MKVLESLVSGASATNTPPSPEDYQPELADWPDLWLAHQKRTLSIRRDLLRFHTEASADRSRTREMRQWHAGQCQILIAKERAQWAGAFSWEETCRRAAEQLAMERPL